MDKTLERDGLRYRWLRDNIQWFIDDGDGVAGCAYSSHIDLSTIEKASTAELLDRIVDANSPLPAAGPTEKRDG